MPHYGLCPARPSLVCHLKAQMVIWHRCSEVRSGSLQTSLWGTKVLSILCRYFGSSRL
ncbi:hypothetical protein HAX54_037136, partial [Datura stramonium]|nr:hypothetical protein [Datura stramonium]